MQIKRKTKLMIFGIIVVVIGIIIGIIPIFLQKDKEEKENIKVEEYIEETSSKAENNNKIVTNTDSYLLVLEIPKLNFKRGVFPLTSSLNTIEKNVEIMKESSLPTDNFGNVVLEAHNGTADISYFKELHRLNVDDYVYIYYQGIKYKYKVSNIYDVTKDGEVEVYRDQKKSTLTLITCKRNTEDRQLVVVSYLIHKEKY